MTIIIVLACAALLLVLAVLACVVGRWPSGSFITYGASCVLTLIALLAGAAQLLSHAPVASINLPLGVPWIGAHFRLDALSAFFVIVVDLGAVAASVFAIGYGAHEHSAPTRAPVLSRIPRRHEPGGARRRRVQFLVRLGVHVAFVMGAGDGARSRSRRTCARAMSIW